MVRQITRGGEPQKKRAKLTKPKIADSVDVQSKGRELRNDAPPAVPPALATHSISLAAAIDMFATEADKAEAQAVIDELNQNQNFVREVIANGLRADQLFLFKNGRDGIRNNVKATIIDKEIWDMIQANSDEIPEVNEILARALISGLVADKLVAYGRINGFFAPIRIPAAEWHGEWGFIRAKNQAFRFSPPIVIDDVRVLLAADAAVLENERGAGNKKHPHWPQLMHEFLKRMISKGHPRSGAEAYRWIQEAAQANNLHEFGDTAIKEHLIATFSQDFWDSLAH